MKKIFVGCFVTLVLLLITPFLLVFGASFLNTHESVQFYHEGEGQAPESRQFADEITLKFVTFNIQDMAYVSQYGNNDKRMRAIAAKLAQTDPDIVGFQESFVDANRDILIDELGQMTRLKHHMYLSSGLVGSGIMISSAYPFSATGHSRFRDSNQWWKVWEGDWWAGKGVQVARVETPAGSVDFFNTHAQADYGVAYNEQMRKKQMEQMAKFINSWNQQWPVKAPIIAVGDVNCRRGDPDYEALVNEAGLERLMNIDSRIDHIFGKTDPAYQFEVVETLPIEEHVKFGELEFELSDHTGYLSEIKITPLAARGVEPNAEANASPAPTESE